MKWCVPLGTIVPEWQVKLVNPQSEQLLTFYFAPHLLLAGKA
jgi:hypothetical protein